MLLKKKKIEHEAGNLTFDLDNAEYVVWEIVKYLRETNDQAAHEAFSTLTDAQKDLALWLMAGWIAEVNNWNPQNEIN